jgi:hypothetical protein
MCRKRIGIFVVKSDMLLQEMLARSHLKGFHLSQLLNRHRGAGGGVYGRSTGPNTEAGRQRCAEAKTIYGRETRETRTERSLVSARLVELESVGFSIGLMSGNRTRGPQPSKMGQAPSALQRSVHLKAI